MPSIYISVNATYQDRHDHPIYLASESKLIHHTLNNYAVDMSIDLNDNSSLPIKLIADRGLQIGDLLIYSAAPTNLCFKTSDGEFITHILDESPLILGSEHRFPINTEKDLLWCYEKRTYTVNLTK